MRTDRRLLTMALAATLALAVQSCARTHRGTAAGLSGVVSISRSASAPVTPSTTPGPIKENTQIKGVLVPAGGLDLSIDYVGGDCDVSASARADEAADAITVHVLVRASGGICSAVGDARTANAVLTSPWNGRKIVDVTGATVPTMDATLLLQPTWLPPGFVLAGIARVGATDGYVDAVETWSVPSSLPSPGESTCTPSQDALSVAQGVRGPQLPGYPAVPGVYAVNGSPATLQRANDPFDTGALFLSWTPPDRPSGWTITVSAAPQCQGDLPLPSDVVLRFANAMR